MQVSIVAGAGKWAFTFVEADEPPPPPPPPPSVAGAWKLAPEAGALWVGDAGNGQQWWANNETDVATRACLFDDVYGFHEDGMFHNDLGDATWLEGWQDASLGDGAACGTPVAPHNGMGEHGWSYDDVENTITLTGIGAYLGIAKAINGAELGADSDVPSSRTYKIESLEEERMQVSIVVGAGKWAFTFVKTDEAGPGNLEEFIAGTWKISTNYPSGVGSEPESFEWWNSMDHIDARACWLDDEYDLDGDGAFGYWLGEETWLEPWQGMDPEGCGAPVAPHDGMGQYSWSIDESGDFPQLILSGVGAYLGLPKVANGGDINDNNAVPDTRKYNILGATENLLLVSIETSGAHWTWTLERVQDEPENPDVVTFTKDDGADWLLPENQDRITDNVWITRGNSGHLFNIAVETSSNDTSPAGVMWNYGTTHQVMMDQVDDTSTYSNLKDIVNTELGGFNNITGETFSMYLVEDDLFFDVRFDSWSGGNAGGGFSYTRVRVEHEPPPQGPVTFTKPDGTDWEFPENQDRITDNVWITRDDTGWLFNAADEDYSGDISPSGTKWAYGTTDEASDTSYDYLSEVVFRALGSEGEDDDDDYSGGFQYIEGETFSLHLVEEDLYFDVTFHSWTCCGDTEEANGGGFSYTRVPYGYGPPSNNLLVNSSFEDSQPADGVGGTDWRHVAVGWEQIGGTWEHHIESSGAGVHNSDEPFEAFEGNKSLKVWNAGDDATLDYYQLMDAMEPGTMLRAGAHMISFPTDWIGTVDENNSGLNSGQVFIGFYDASGSLINGGVSESINGGDA